MNNDDNNTLMMIKKVKTKVIISIFLVYENCAYQDLIIHWVKITKGMNTYFGAVSMKILSK